MQKTPNYQDQFLSAARREKSVVTIFLMNGFQLKGVIRGFDSFVVMVESEGKQQMIFKHAISTIAPPRPLELREDT
ncbi:MAG: RNA chaperone Hfq [Oscillospiraceae bacterium]|nr:RNA chaperone Hfq [Oscillospiraceae bacterium]